MGDLIPEAQTNGSFGLNFIAFICNKLEAIKRSDSFLLNMPQSYKIHLNDNIVYLISESEWILKNSAFNENHILVHYENAQQLSNYILQIPEKFHNQSFYVVGKDMEIVKRDFFSNYKLVIAGGCVVFNKNKEILFIFRNGYWDLPKGKIEVGENIKEGSVREVVEETNCKIKGVLFKIGCTYHTYKIEKDNILKETHWFAMRGKTKSVLEPQIDEGILKAEWVGEQYLNAYLDSSYENIKDVIGMAVKMLAERQSL